LFAEDDLEKSRCLLQTAAGFETAGGDTDRIKKRLQGVHLRWEGDACGRADEGGGRTPPARFF
jgi:hypothetical protein